MSDPVLREGLESAESTRPDLLLFVLAVLGGVTAYLYMHEAHMRQLHETVVICGIMVSYAYLVCRIPRVRVRLDQAGDNAYYMGLLFTLTSMAIALHEFSGSEGEDGTEQIVSNFGIALASTICGIFLRVCLHQMRVDPVDVENMTRIELAEATSRVRSTLGSLTSDVTLFHREMHQRLNDAVQDFTEIYRSTTERYTQEMSTAAGRVMAAADAHQTSLLERGTTLIKLAESAAESAASAASRLRAIDPPSADFSLRLEQAVRSLADLVGPIQQLQGALEKTGASAEGALKNMAEVTGQLLASGREEGQQRAQLLTDMASSATQLQSALAQTGATLQDERALLSQLEADARRASAEAVRAGEAASEVLQTLTEVTRGLTQLLRADTGSPQRQAASPALAEP